MADIHKILSNSGPYVAKDGSLGIGMASPAKDLVINNATGAQLQLQLDGSDRFRMEADSFGGSFYSPSGYGARFFTSGYERMRITSQGKVGIATDNPLHTLQIGTAATNGGYSIMVEGNFANDALLSNPRINLIDTNFGITAGKYGSGGADDAIGIFAYQGAGRGILFAHTTAGSGTHLKDMRHDMFVDGGTGNVGIGETDPFGRLNITRAGINEGAISFDDQANNAHLVLAGSDALVRMQLGTYNNGSYGAWIQASYDNGGTAYGTEPLILNPQGGNVGIGTEDPKALLELYSTGAASPASSGTTQSAGNRLRLGRTDGAVLDIGSNGGNGLWLQTGNGADLSTTYDLLLNPNSGNVGIGVSPSAKLHVAGNSILANNTSIDPDSVANTVVAGAVADGSGWGLTTAIGGNAGTGHSWALGSNGSAFYMGYQNGSADNTLQSFLITYTNRNVQLVPTSGNVGIGNVTPNDGDSSIGAPKLHVLGVESSGKNLVARFQAGNDSDNTYASMMLNHANDRGLIFHGGRAASNRAIGFINLIQYDGSELTDGITLHQPNSGSAGATSGTNVGIGTTAPGRKLTVTGDVSGDANNLLIANENDTDGDSASIGFSMLSNDTYVKAGIFFKRTTTQGRGDLIFATNDEVNGNNVTLSNARMIIDRSGDVLINQSSNLTNQPLQVNGFLDITDVSGSALRWYNGSTFRGGLGLDDWAHSGSANDTTMYISGDNSFFVSTNNVKRLEINSSGATFLGQSIIDQTISTSDTNELSWRSLSSYSYSTSQTPNTQYYYNKIAQLATNSGTLMMEYYAQSDVNYPRAASGRFTVSTWNNTTINVNHLESTVTDPIEICIYIDDSRNVWIKGENVVWDSRLYVRAVAAKNVTLFYGNDTAKTLTQPSGSVEIKAGVSKRLSISDVDSNASGFTPTSNYATTEYIVNSIKTTSAGTFGGNLTVEGGTLNLSDGSQYDSIINSGSALTLNFDSDNNSTGEVFRINHNTTGVNANNLFNITEAGYTTVAGTVEARYIYANNPSGAANGSAQETARFVNMTSGATSSYMYIGAYSGTDWRLGKNIMGTSSNNNFGITKHSGTAIALEIDASLRTRLRSTDDYVLGLVDSSGTDQWWLKAYNSNGDFAIHENGVGDKFTIAAGGNTGIGYTSPQFKLHVVGASDTEATVARFAKGNYADTGGHTTIVGLGAENSASWTKSGLAFERTGSYDRGKIHFLQENTGTTDTVTLSDSVMTIQPDGKVGIGTDSPAYRVEINDDTENGRAIQAVQSATSGTNYGFQGGAYGVGATKNIGLHITAEGATTNVAGVFVGDVGVGTASPTANLHVQDTSTATLKVITTGVADASVNIQGYDAGVHLGDATNGLRWAIWNDGPSTSSSLKFGSYALGTWYANASQVMTMTSAGEVGIGTVSPSATLHLSDAANSATTTFSANGRITMSGDGVLRWGSAAAHGTLTWDSTYAKVHAQGTDRELHLGSGNDSDAVKIIGSNTTFAGNIKVGSGIGAYETQSIVSQSGQRTLIPKNSRKFLGNSSTGAIAITSPLASTDSMYTIKGTIFEYSINQSFEFVISGYYYQTSWYNTTAYIVGHADNSTLDRNFTVRFGYDGSNKPIVYIGETDSTWSYCTVYISEINYAWSMTAAEMESYLDGWTISGGNTSFSNEQSSVRRENCLVTNWSRNGSKVYYNLGNVGVGTDDPTTTLSVQGTSSNGINVIGVNTTATRVFAGLNSSNHGYLFVTGSSGQNPSLINSAGGDSYIGGGFLGIRETSPSAPLHVVAASSANNALIQRWSYTSGSSAYQLDLKQTVTSGVVRYNFSMVNNNTAYNDVLVLDRGKVGIGETDPSYPLDVNGNASNISIYASHDVAAYSDARVKTDIKTIPNALDKVNKLRGVTFKRTDEGSTDKRMMGVIAQEVLDIIPEVVNQRESDGHYSVSYGNMVGVLIEAVKELTAEVEELKKLKCKCHGDT